MKKSILIISAGILFVANPSFGQDISSSQVPSLVINSFQKAFQKVHDIEWKKKGDLYNVDFETGLFTDHEAWFDGSGKLIKHKEEISGNQLPEKVRAKIRSDFEGFSIEDAKIITSEDKVSYVVELDSLTQDWKIVFDKEGNILSKLAD